MTSLAHGLRSSIVRWWAGETGWPGRLLLAALAPAEALYAGAVAARALAYRRGWAPVDSPGVPIISVGNISVGGTGKTPFTAWIAAQLKTRGRTPAVVLRGYGADEVRVHRELNPNVPVFTGARRSAAVRRAIAAGCDVALLDDAFQHRAVHRDLDIVLLAAESWASRRRLLPRGPWREPISALHRADLLVVTRKSCPTERAERVAQDVAQFGVPFALCHFAPSHFTALGAGHVRLPLDAVRGRAVLAVASLADPAPFAAQLRAMGAVTELIAYPDHHPFSAADVASLLNAGGPRTLIVTHKEAVKLRPLMPAGAPVLVLHQEVRIEQGREQIEQALSTALREHA